jgi:pyruvate formate lyase activating enzyme
MDKSECNLGGFIPISTVDWPGVAATIVFLKGCPNYCYDCHNQHLMTEGNPVPMDLVLEDIALSSNYVSALIVSGGESTKHIEELVTILKYAKSVGLKTRIQTSGVYSNNLNIAIKSGFLDSVALDIKMMDRFSDKKYAFDYKVSLDLCLKLFLSGELKDLEIVYTVFPGTNFDQNINQLSNEIPDNIRLIVQQGIPRNRDSVPITRDELIKIAKTLKQTDVRVRTRTNGEEVI